MSCYINSNNNRFYAAGESEYGQVGAITAANRFPAVQLNIKQAVERPERKDKTGGRTFTGMPTGLRRKTVYDVQTYLTGWSDQSTEPGYGPLVKAAMGGAAEIHGGGQIDTALSATRLKYSAPHLLTPGQAVAFGGEIRFVTAVVDAQTIEVNAPFSVQPSSGSPMGKTITYQLGDDLPSVSIFDYWDPSSAVQRILSGAAVDQFVMKVNGDYHEFSFKGAARDVIDSSSFASGQAALTQFPIEPAIADNDYEIVPGHLGQVWLGSTPERFFTLTQAEIALQNQLDLRAREFGSDGPRCIAAGRRHVNVNLSLYEQGDAATVALYQAAKQRSPITAMFQLGQQPGQLLGVYMKSIVPEVPEFEDKEAKLQWKFSECRAQGTFNDELIVAFA